MKWGLEHGSGIRNVGVGWWRDLKSVAITYHDKPEAIEAALQAVARRERSDPFAVRRARLYMERGILSADEVKKGASV